MKRKLMVSVLAVSLVLGGAAWAGGHHDDDDEGGGATCTSEGGRTTLICEGTTVTVTDTEAACPAVNCTCSCALGGNHVCGKLRAKQCKALGFRSGCQRCVEE